jgi:hypothetical protein
VLLAKDTFLLAQWILVASTKYGKSSLWFSPAIVTERSCIASSSAACVFGGVLLISSARIIFEKIGPL